jgi:GcrA cell cycle regulator
MGTVTHTPERLVLFRQIWADGILEGKDVLERMNELPGPFIKNVKILHSWAVRIGVTRDKATVANRSALHGSLGGEMQATAARTKYAALMVLAESDAVATRVQIYDPNWPDNQTLGLIRGWRAGKSAGEIAREIGSTKNAIIGKAHRLISAGLLEPRPSPIRRDAPPRARLTRSLSPQAATIPPLKSALVTALPLAPVVIASRPAHRSVRPAPMLVPRVEPPKPVSRPVLVAESVPSAMGPSQTPCQWPVVNGSVITPWVFCGVDRVKWPYCETHFAAAYISIRAKRDDVAVNYTLGQQGAKTVSVGA